MFINLNRYIGSILFLIGWMACSQSSKKPKEHENQAAIVQKLSPTDSSFKKWAIDTIRILNATSYDTSLKKISYYFSEDSLTLIISDNYQFVYTHQPNKIDRNCRNLLSLLKEYGELPPLYSNCSFSIKVSFYPSVVKERLYDYVYEWDNIEIKTKNESLKYGYIRGRLNGKKILINNPKDSAYYEFIWKDNTLTKVKMGD